MPAVRAENLEDLVRRIFSAAGAPTDTAAYVARSLVGNNLLGHDSHGVLQVTWYVDLIRQERIRPAARPTVIKETDTTALVDGNGAFGQVAARFAAELAIEKARRMQVSAVGIVRLAHVGRLGEFVEMVAREGMFGLMVVGGSGAWQRVAPYGGRSGVLSTNPYAFALPAGDRPLMVLDFATTVLAEGKLQVARSKGEAIPAGAVLDKDGRPTTDPEAFYQGGVLLPFGGHKGYGLALLAEALASPLIAADLYSSTHRPHGTLMLAVNVEAFRPLAEFGRRMDALLTEVKAVPPAEGFDEVLVPGEPEQRILGRRREEGIPLPETIWERLLAVAREAGVDVHEEGLVCES